MVKYGYFRAFSKDLKRVTYITVAFEQDVNDPTLYKVGFAVCQPFEFWSYSNAWTGDKFKKSVGRNIAKGRMEKTPYRYFVDAINNTDITLVLWAILDDAIATNATTKALPRSIEIANKRDLIRFGLDSSLDKSIDNW